MGVRKGRRPVYVATSPFRGAQERREGCRTGEEGRCVFPRWETLKSLHPAPRLPWPDPDPHGAPPLTQVIDHSGARLGEYEDVSRVEKYTISQEAYDQRQDTVRSFLKRSKLGRYNEEERAQQEAEAAQRLAEEKAQASSIPVGSRCEVRAAGHSPRRGTVMYVGAWSAGPGVPGCKAGRR
uniref:Uncharacterized protein n=1 Tax=Theropithecus gelada TaxID=9565 RepID=A0A8D2FEN7_THEGE